jgi:hypothetical protein
VIRFGVVVLGAVLAINGCSAGAKSRPPAAPTTPETAAKRVRTLPLPTSVWEKATNREHYKVFATHAEAAAWFDAWKVGPGGASRGATKDVVIAGTDPRQAALAEDLAKVWGVFRELFPRDCEGLDAPQILLTTARRTNAYVLFDRSSGERSSGLQPHVIFVSGGSLGARFDPVTREALRGLIAHELTHHVLKHSWPGHDKKAYRFYSTKAAKGAGFGFEQDDDPAMRESGEKYLRLAESTGDFPLREWNGVVRDASAAEVIRQELHREAAKATPTLCTQADEARAKLDTHSETILDYTFMSVRAAPAQLVELDTLSKAYVAAESACAASYPKTLFEVTAELFGKTEAEVRESATPNDRAINDGASNAFDALAKIASTNDEVLLGIDVSTLRYYTVEEQADDVAIEVLSRIGADPLALTNFLENLYVVGADRAACRKEIALGEPTYGILSSSHHSPCWRIAHGRALASWLTTPS